MVRHRLLLGFLYLKKTLRFSTLMMRLLETAKKMLDKILIHSDF